MISKFKVGDKAYKPSGYKFPCVIRSVFTNSKGEVRVVAEMISEDGKGMLHIFNEKQLEHVKDTPEKIQTDLIVESVIMKLLKRSEKGIKEYGTTLKENDNLNFLEELQEELMDAINYIEKLLDQKN